MANESYYNHWHSWWIWLRKTTVTNEIMKNLEGHSVALLAQDYYYKDQKHLTFDERLETNYDHPFAFDNDLLIENLKDLKMVKQ